MTLISYFLKKRLANGVPPMLSFYTLQNIYSGFHLKMITRKDLMCKKHHKSKWRNGLTFKKLRLNFGRGIYLERKRNFRKKIICSLNELKENREFLWNKGSYKIKLLTNPGKEIEETHKRLKYLKTTSFKKKKNKTKRTGEIKSEIAQQQ